jgi:DNA-binding MarR family transcriptional regulator
MDVSPQADLLVYSLTHLLEVTGWIQHSILADQKLDLIQVSFLRRSDREGRVSFSRMRRELNLSFSLVSRAASELERRGLGSVRVDKGDRRYRRFHINKKGEGLIRNVELQISKSLLRNMGVFHNDSRRYHDFTIHLWNVTRFLPTTGVEMPGVFYCTDIPFDEKIGPDQIDSKRFMEDFVKEPQFDLPKLRSRLS